MLIISDIVQRLMGDPPKSRQISLLPELYRQLGMVPCMPMPFRLMLAKFACMIQTRT